MIIVFCFSYQQNELRHLVIELFSCIAWQLLILCLFILLFTDYVDEIQQYRTIAKGMMVGLYVEDYWPRVCPQIACVEDMSLEEETVRVHWYSASWTGPCKERNSGVGANRKKVTEVLDIRCCVLWQFNLTSKRKSLPDIIAKKLKSTYRDLGLDV